MSIFPLPVRRKITPQAKPSKKKGRQNDEDDKTQNMEIDDESLELVHPFNNTGLTWTKISDHIVDLASNQLGCKNRVAFSLGGVTGMLQASSVCHNSFNHSKLKVCLQEPLLQGNCCFSGVLDDQLIQGSSFGC